MTAGQFGEVDFDRLADYVGGALDGTPDEAAVARLIDEDPAWARAYETLGPAVDAVHDNLTDLGAAATTMPPEVADRLVAALAAAGQEAAEEAADEPVPRLSAVPDVPDAPRTDGPDVGTRGRARARRRWSRLAAPVAVAAAVAAFAGFGVSRLVNDDPARDATDSAARTEAGRGSALAPGGPGTPRALLEPAGPGVVTSGTDYARDTLAARINGLTRRTAGGEKSGPSAASAPERGNPMAAASGLDRLVDRGALATCLDAVAVAHAGGALAVDLVDYASYEGAPALVIAFADQSGTRWAWVAGPECGLPGSGADTRYQARVG